MVDIAADVAEPKMSGTVAGKVNINNEQQVISFKLTSPHTFLKLYFHLE